MPTLFLMCGLPGSGKTTLAKQIEQERSALRLSPDEWITALNIDLYDEATRAVIEALQWNVAESVLRRGVDVILENGFWARAEREDYRLRGIAAGASVQVRFLDVTRDELWHRIHMRNADLPPGSARIDPESLDLWWRLFERPSSDELSHHPKTTLRS